MTGLLLLTVVVAGAWAYHRYIKAKPTRPAAGFTELMTQERSCGLNPKSSDYP